MKTAFDDVKLALTEATLLYHPTDKTPLIFSTGASDVAIRDALRQRKDKKLCPLSFYPVSARARAVTNTK